MDRILIIMRNKMDTRQSSAPLLGLFSIICKHVYFFYNRSQVSIYRTIGPLVMAFLIGTPIKDSSKHHFSPVMRKTEFCVYENKDADQLHRNSGAVFATRIVKYLYFLNPKSPADSHLL